MKERFDGHAGVAARARVKGIFEKVVPAVCTDDITHAVVDPAANLEAAYLVAHSGENAPLDTRLDALPDQDPSGHDSPVQCWSRLTLSLRLKISDSQLILTPF